MCWRSLIVLWTTITNDSHIYVSQLLVSLNIIITCKQSLKWLILMIYNVLVVFYKNYYIFDISDFLLPQTPGATYMIHMTNSLNYYNLFYFLLFMTKSLLFYDQIFFFLMWCILRLSRVKIIMYIFDFYLQTICDKRCIFTYSHCQSKTISDLKRIVTVTIFCASLTIFPRKQIYLNIYMF